MSHENCQIQPDHWHVGGGDSRIVWVPDDQSGKFCVEHIADEPGRLCMIEDETGRLGDVAYNVRPTQIALVISGIRRGCFVAN